MAKKWIQKATTSINRRGTAGKCSGSNFGSSGCPPGSKAYNLAVTFRKMARARKKKELGGSLPEAALTPEEMEFGGAIGSAIGAGLGLATMAIPGVGPVISPIVTPLLSNIGGQIGGGIDQRQAEKKAAEALGNVPVQPEGYRPQTYKHGGRLTSSKAREVLSHGMIRGKKLTEKQRAFFGAMSSMKHGGKLYDSIGDNTLLVKGKSHAQGGVDYKGIAEVEKGETIDEGNNRVFSDSIGLDGSLLKGTKGSKSKVKSIADKDKQLASRIGALQKRLGSGKDKILQTSIDLLKKNRDGLFAFQENSKKKLMGGELRKYVLGGKLKGRLQKPIYAEGGPFPFIDPYLLQSNMNEYLASQYATTASTSGGLTPQGPNQIPTLGTPYTNYLASQYPITAIRPNQGTTQNLSQSGAPYNQAYGLQHLLNPGAQQSFSQEPNFQRMASLGPNRIPMEPNLQRMSPLGPNQISSSKTSSPFLPSSGYNPLLYGPYDTTDPNTARKAGKPDETDSGASTGLTNKQAGLLAGGSGLLGAAGGFYNLFRGLTEKPHKYDFKPVLDTMATKRYQVSSIPGERAIQQSYANRPRGFRSLQAQSASDLVAQTGINRAKGEHFSGVQRQNIELSMQADVIERARRLANALSISEKEAMNLLMNQQAEEAKKQLIGTGIGQIGSSLSSSANMLAILSSMKTGG